MILLSAAANIGIIAEANRAASGVCKHTLRTPLVVLASSLAHSLVGLIASSLVAVGARQAGSDRLGVARASGLDGSSETSATVLACLPLAVFLELIISCSSRRRLLKSFITEDLDFWRFLSLVLLVCSSPSLA